MEAVLEITEDAGDAELNAMYKDIMEGNIGANYSDMTNTELNELINYIMNDESVD